ncbi:MAG TPA: TonB-dependent receptor [Steroidobacteraceae bacterium]|jgi:outer membrane receptor protein involved in Fe transport|nr:TonB-dependent receptor [Steroidobacteraceae bacterium]
MVNNDLGNSRLRKAVRLALTGSSMAATFGVVHAQTAPAAAAAPANSEALQEVVVTGSRISVPNQVSISPVTFVSAVDVAQTGATRIEDLLNQLPQVFAAQGAMISNGATGTADIDLRGLGPKRTLVLVNGLRLGPGDPRTGAASDLNMIPAEMIDSIEVLTGGASSTYGADAVGGVVNFKLNDHFEGVKIVADAGIYNHSNKNTDGVEDAVAASGFQQAPSTVNTGAQKSIAFIAGLNSSDGKGNATIYATYRNVAAILEGKYSYSACTLNSGYATSNSGKFSCGGSSTAFPGRFRTVGAGAPPSDNTIGPNGTLIPWTNANLYNFGAINFFQRPDERYSAGAFLHYDFNEHAQVYANTMFMDDKSLAQIAASGAFFANFPVNCANPFLSTQELAAWCGGSTAGETTNLFIGRRNVEGGGRVDNLEHTDWRVSLGVKGKIVDGWDYDASWQHSIVNLSESQENYFSTAKIDNALNVIQTPTGPQCISAVNGTQPNCVPYNIFSLGQVTPAALNYLQVPGIQTGNIIQTVVAANFTGDLGMYGVQLPTAGSGLKVNFGAEWRDVTEETTPDEEFRTGDLAGTGGIVPATHGGIISREGFIEARMPLIEDHFLAQSLAVETGYRYSDYNLGFKTNTYKFGVEYSPIKDVRLRASFQRAVRAPNVTELFLPQTVALDGNADPCAGTAAQLAARGVTQAQCIAAGVPAAAFGTVVPNQANQYQGLVGGNPTLGPETALTSSFGIGWTPSFVPGLRLQVDYFDIKIENVITTIGATAILQQCIQSGLFCDKIHRDLNNSLWLSPQAYVIDSLANVGKLETRGVDFDLSYGFDIGPAGRIRTSLIGTYVDEYVITPIASDSSTKFNCAGLYGDICSSGAATANPIFRWRHTLRTTWSTPWQGLDITAAWRYFSAMKLDSLSPQSNLSGAPATVANGGISSSDAAIKAYNYLDLSAAVKVMDKMTFRVGVNNVFDKDPPIIGGTNLPGIAGNGNTFPQVYDSLGRFIFGQLTVQF